jgi:hypothetical protein
MTTQIPARTYIEQWAPLHGYLRRSVPAGNSDTWSETDSPVAQYIRSLKKIGKDDPTDATYYFTQACTLREARDKVIARQPEEPEHYGPGTIKALIAGDLTEGDAGKRLAKIPTEKDVAEKLERQRQMISAATREAYGMSVREINGYGEDGWLKLLKPIAVEAYSARDQNRWDAVHNFAAILRNPELSGLSGIFQSPGGSLEFAETWRYKVGRPDLYHFWRVRHAEDAQNIEFVHGLGSNTYLATAVVKGPHPTLSQIDPSWEPGLYSAQEVKEIAARIVAEQEEIRMTDPNEVPNASPNGKSPS